MPKNKIIFALLTSVFLMATSWLVINSKQVISNQMEASDSLEVLSIDGMYLVYSDVNELEEWSDLIVVGHPTEDFLEREHVNKYFDDGALEDFYTITNFEITEVIKNSDDISYKPGDTIEIIEPIGVLNRDDGEKVAIVMEDYTEMKKGSEYIVFLMKNTFGDYSVISNNFGKFNLDGTDPEDLEIIEKGNPKKKNIDEDFHENKDFKAEMFKKIKDKYKLKD